jgi:hypothetical protein
VAHFQLLAFQQRADRIRQFEQAQQVRHCRARPANRLGSVLVGQRELVDQSRQRHGLLERVEVFALDVLDQRHRDHRAVVDVAQHHRHVVEAGLHRRAPAALAGDDLELVARDLARDDRLDHALRLDRFRQLGESVDVDGGARLVLAGAELADGDVAQAFARHLRRRRRLQRGRFGAAAPAQQRFQAAAQSGLARRHQAVSFSSLLSSRSRRTISPASPM